MYESNGCIKFAEVDQWGDGCIDSPLNYSIFVNYQVKGETLKDIKQAIADFTSCGIEGMDINSCDEIGRIDAQVMENTEGYPASEHELALWKEGNCTLFAVTYSFQFEEVTRKPAEFNV